MYFSVELHNNRGCDFGYLTSCNYFLKPFRDELAPFFVQESTKRISTRLPHHPSGFASKCTCHNKPQYLIRSCCSFPRILLLLPKSSLELKNRGNHC